MTTSVLAADSVRAEVRETGGNKLGGYTAILIGVLNIILVVYVVGATGDQRFDSRAFFEYFSERPLALSMAWIVISLSAVLAYAVVPVFSDMVSPVNREWTRFATIFGLVGFTVMGVWAITLTRTMPELSDVYRAGSEAVKDAIAANGLREIDPDGWFSFGGPGLWLIVTNILAIRGKKLQLLHALSGIMLGVGLWSTVFGALFGFEPLNLYAAGSAALFYPIFFIWLGIRLLRQT